MKLEDAQQTISKWMISSGKQVYVPDYMIAINACALTSSDLDQQVFTTLREMEDDLKYWSLWAFHTIRPYMNQKDALPPELKRELSHIVSIALKHSATCHGQNPWRYQLSYNPLQGIIDLLQSW